MQNRLWLSFQHNHPAKADSEIEGVQAEDLPLYLDLGFPDREISVNMDWLQYFITLRTGGPQRCVLSPPHFTLLTHNCRVTNSSNHIKFTHDMAVLGLISRDDESPYREELEQLSIWYKDNNLSLTIKTMEIIIDFKKTCPDHTPVSISGSAVEIAKSPEFLRVHITEDLDQQHHLPNQESPAEHTLPEVAKMGKPSYHHPHHILQRQHQECSDQLHHYSI